MTVAPAVGYIASTVPAKVEYSSDTTLFQIAQRDNGDPLQWAFIASANQIADPWLTPCTRVLIPPIFPTTAPTGILAPTWPLIPGQLPPATVNPATLTATLIGQAAPAAPIVLPQPIGTYVATFFLYGF